LRDAIQARLSRRVAVDLSDAAAVSAELVEVR
jgi:hypothetical protein